MAMFFTALYRFGKRKSNKKSETMKGNKRNKSATGLFTAWDVKVKPNSWKSGKKRLNSLLTLSTQRTLR
ncbi:Uncharacterized protein APZ42_005640 [Daphnia magna]|uniref:Uncharacterized protein n=1 Tax=Daphnia magna TaxID=35525 RepID=A0A164GC98_9CRUS|nr:Uncharacterized protein APZ42_005640 [Daphnia magna]